MIQQNFRQVSSHKIALGYVYIMGLTWIITVVLIQPLMSIMLKASIKEGVGMLFCLMPHHLI